LRPVRLAEHASHLSERRDELRRALSDFFKTAPRFVWEVGSGHGHFLTAYAKAHPNETCIGVDITSDRIARADRKRDRARLGNLHFVRGDAADFLAVMPEKARFTSVFILFPDPWPKRRHHKNRVVTEEFLSSVSARASKGAPLYFRTDHEPYYRHVLALLRLHADWSEPETGAWPFDESTVFQKRAAHHFSLVATRR
jgi:tRNA (guanine-N7-)-methyltransferase